MKCCRLQSKRRQDEIAQELGVCTATLRTWEHGVRPAARYWPAIIALLGQDPSPQPETVGARIRAARRMAGLTAKALARAVGCDRETLAKWEQNLRDPGPEHAARLAAILGLASGSPER